MGPDTSSNLGRQRHRTDAARGKVGRRSTTLAKLRPGTYKVTARSVQVATGAQRSITETQSGHRVTGQAARKVTRFSTSVGPAALADRLPKLNRARRWPPRRAQKPARQHHGTTRRRGRKGQR